MLRECHSRVLDLLDYWSYSACLGSIDAGGSYRRRCFPALCFATTSTVLLFLRESCSWLSKPVIKSVEPSEEVTIRARLEPKLWVQDWGSVVRKEGIGWQWLSSGWFLLCLLLVPYLDTLPNSWSYISVSFSHLVEFFFSFFHLLWIDLEKSLTGFVFVVDPTPICILNNELTGSTTTRRDMESQSIGVCFESAFFFSKKKITLPAVKSRHGPENSQKGPMSHEIHLSSLSWIPPEPLRNSSWIPGAADGSVSTDIPWAEYRRGDQVRIKFSLWRDSAQ